MNMKYAKRSEDTEQIAVIQWAQWNEGRYPELKWLHHIPNGGSRNRLEAVKLKQMGVKAGVSDLCLPYPKGIYCGLYIEMKFGTNLQQDTQKEFLQDMAEAGHFVATCYGAEEAVRVLEEYLMLDNPQTGEDAYVKKTVRVLEKYIMPDVLEKGEDAYVAKMVMNIPNNSILKDGKVAEK